MSLHDAIGSGRFIRPMKGWLVASITTLVLLAVTTTASSQTTYLWNDSSSVWTAPSSWTPNGPSNWTDPQRLADTIVSFGSQATIANQPSLGGNDVFVNGVNINSSQAAWSVSGTGVLNVSSGGMTVIGAGNNTSTISAPIQLTTPQTWSIGPDTSLNVSSVLSGVGNLTKAGNGTLILSGSSVNTGTTTVTAGVLVVSGDRSAATGELLAAGGVIRFGEGATMGGNVTFQANQSGTAGSQTNSPHIFGDAPEEIDIMGDMTAEKDAILEFEIDGLLPDLEYDRVNVGGEVRLDDAFLDLEAGIFSANIGDAYYIINNQGSDPIFGQFANAPEGAILHSNGHAFRITYFADLDTLGLTGGNDIALVTVPEVPAHVLLLSAAAFLACAYRTSKTRKLKA